jgi:hypothetical protein
MRVFNGLLALTFAVFVGSALVAGQGLDSGSTIGGPQEPPCDRPLKAAMGPATEAKPMPAAGSAKGYIGDVMNAMMVPSSTIVWNAVATQTDATGVHESRPETNEQWNIIYHAAIELSEVPNLLLVPGRERCVGGPIPLAYREDFARKARELQEAGHIATIAAKKHDADALAEAGERIDVACDACHEKYQIAKGDPDNWKKVLGTYKLTPEEAAAGAKARAALAAQKPAPKPAATPAPK